MNKQELAQMYRDYLAEEGYAPRIDDDGDLVFKVEGRTYLIIIDEEDATYFRLAFPNFWPIESEEERARVIVAASTATGRTKVAKVYLVRDNVWATIEMFIDPPTGFRTVFRRALSALRASVENFAEKMRE